MFILDNLGGSPKNCGVQEMGFEGFIKLSSKFQQSLKNPRIWQLCSLVMTM
jgi:hypothetical protein